MESLSTSLFVTLIGMAAVFLAMALIYASMRLLTALARDKREDEPQAGTEPEPTTLAQDRGRRLNAAAIAVALAQAERDESVSMRTRVATESAPWGEFYRHRQLRPSGRGRIG